MASETSAALRIIFSADSEQLDAAIRTLNSKLEQTGKRMQKMGRTMTRNVTAPLVAIAGASLKTAVDFEFAMAKVQAVSGFTAQEMQKLSNSAQDFGAKTAFSASEVAELQKELAKLGFESGEIIDLTDGVLSLAQAFDLELGDAAEKVALTLNRFGLEADQSGRVADVMAKSFGSSALDAEKFEEAMKTVGPVAKSLGFELEEVTGILGVLANNGISGSIAGTKLTRVLSVMAKEGIDVKDGFAQLLTETTSVKDAFDRFGARGAGIVPILQENSDEVGRLTEEFHNAAGTASEARAVMDDTAQGALARMRSALEAAAIKIGDALLPSFLMLVDKVTSLATSFGNLNPATQKFIIGLGGVAAAVGPALSGLGRMMINLQGLVPLLAKARTAAVALRTAALGPLGIALAAATAATIAYNYYANRHKRRLKEIEEQAKKTRKEHDRYITSLQNEGGKLSDADLNARIKQLEDQQKALGAVNVELPDYIANLAASEELTRAAYQAQQQKQELDENGNIITKKVTGDEKELADVTAELNTLILERNRRTEKKKAADEAARQAAEDAAEAERQQAAATRAATEEARRKAQQAAMDKSMKVGEQFGLAPEDFNVTGLLGALEQGTDAAADFAFAIQAPFMVAQESIEATEETVDNAMTTMEEKAARLAQIGLAVGNAFGAGMASIISGSKSAKAAIVEMIGTMVSGALRASQANIIAAMTNAGMFSGPAAPFVIPALVASGIALVEGLFASIPAMAMGGITTGPTLALLGDNPSGREAVIPFERMGQFMSMAGANSNTVVTGRLQGMDLLLSNERAGLARNRTT